MKPHFNCESLFARRKERNQDSLTVYNCTQKTQCSLFRFFTVNHQSKSFLCLINENQTSPQLWQKRGPMALGGKQPSEEKSFSSVFYKESNLRKKLFMDVLSAVSSHFNKVWPIGHMHILWKLCPSIMTALTTERQLLIWRHSNTDGVRRQMFSNGWQKKLMILLTGNFSATDCQSSKGLQLLDH